MHKYLWMIALIILNGCMVGPDYKRPRNHIPDEWVPQPVVEEVEVTDEAPFTEWWEIFGDPLLTCYINLAAVYNNDVLVAEANFRQARAIRMVTAAPFFPQLAADFNGTRTSFSKNGPLFSILPPTSTATSRPDNTATGANSQFVAQVPQLQNLFNATLDLTWEIDLFGKTRRNIQSATARMQALCEQRNAQLITVIAEVARNYIEIRSNQEKLSLTNENIELVESSAEIIRNRFKAGLSNQLDLERIEAELAQIRATIPAIEASLFSGIYALSVLTGNLPETLLEEMLPFKDLPQIPSELAIGIRSDILRRRPDIRQAERQLAAATADIGVAVASFFPTITLFGDEGFQSLKFSNLFSGRSNTWSYGGDVNLPIFQGGKLVGNLHATQAAQCAAAFTYKQTVLVALQEAEGAFTAFMQDLRTTKQLEDSVGRNEHIVKLSNERYVKGLANLTDLLDSERQLISIQQNALDAKTSALLDLIKLYKALGGGWDSCRLGCQE